MLWFCLIAYAITWACTLLVPVSLLFGFAGLFGPAVAAYVVIRGTAGAAGVQAWREKLGLWRVPLRWYLVALSVPLIVSGAGALASVALGARADLGFLPVDGLKLALFVTVVGEEVGWRGFLGFQVLFLGSITSYLALPLFWLLWTGAMGLALPLWQHLPGPLMQGFFASMWIGQAVMLVTAVIALRDSGRLRMLPWIAALPFYWPLGALAAYRAVAEMVYAPSHWTKTEHGLYLEAGETGGQPAA